MILVLIFYLLPNFDGDGRVIEGVEDVIIESNY